MRITESCAACLYNRQKHLSSDEQYLSEIRRIIDNRGEDDTSPYLVYLFRKVYEKHFGQRSSYRKIKKKYNDLVLSMEDSVRKRIEESEDPLAKAFVYARIGNYIDFGVMNQVDEKTFLSLFDGAELSQEDAAVMEYTDGGFVLKILMQSSPPLWEVKQDDYNSICKIRYVF